MPRKLDLDKFKEELKADKADAATAKKAVTQVKKAAAAIKNAKDVVTKSGQDFAKAEE